MSERTLTQPKTSAAPTFTPTFGAALQRKCACDGNPGPSGECAECQRKRLALQRTPTPLSLKGRGAGGEGRTAPPLLQPKLTIGQPNDPYEQEADRVAETVMRMPDPKVQRQPDDKGVVQAKPVAGQITPLVQTQSTASHTPEVTPAVEANINSMKGGGQPLDPATRAFMEPRFGHDFSQVRVHTDARAAESARAVNALAYTVGSDVVFGAGQYAPQTSAGQRLMAHELTHVVQQARLSDAGYLDQTIQRETEDNRQNYTASNQSNTFKETNTIYQDLEDKDVEIIGVNGLIDVGVIGDLLGWVGGNVKTGSWLAKLAKYGSLLANIFDLGTDIASGVDSAIDINNAHAVARLRNEDIIKNEGFNLSEARELADKDRKAIELYHKDLTNEMENKQALARTNEEKRNLYNSYQPRILSLRNISADLGIVIREFSNHQDRIDELWGLNAAGDTKTYQEKMNSYLQTAYGQPSRRADSIKFEVEAIALSESAFIQMNKTQTTAAWGEVALFWSVVGNIGWKLISGKVQEKTMDAFSVVNSTYRNQLRGRMSTDNEFIKQIPKWKPPK